MGLLPPDQPERWDCGDFAEYGYTAPDGSRVFWNCVVAIEMGLRRIDLSAPDSRG